MNRERRSRATSAERRDERDAIHGAGNVSDEPVDADVAQPGILCVEPEVIRRIQEVHRRLGGVWLCEVQVRIAVAVSFAGGTRQLRITEGHKLRNGGNAAQL